MQELIYPDFRVRRPGFLTDEYARTWDVSANAHQSHSVRCSLHSVLGTDQAAGRDNARTSRPFVDMHCGMSFCRVTLQNLQHLPLDYDLRLRTSGWRRFDSQRGQVSPRTVSITWPVSPPHSPAITPTQHLQRLTRFQYSVQLPAPLTDSPPGSAGKATVAGRSRQHSDQGPSAAAS